jgi:cell division protein ZapB
MTELEALEKKLMQLVELHQVARADNRELRNRITTLEGENWRLTERATEARTRIEALIERLPANLESET